MGMLLAYGIIGLGLALAILAYRLLAAEQKIEKPRPAIITSIYVFMTFSIGLTCIGVFFELKKLPSPTPVGPQSLAQLPDNPDDQKWQEVLSATRQALFGTVMPTVYRTGKLVTGESLDISLSNQPGQCLTYMVMTQPPAHINIAVTVSKSTIDTLLVKEPHFAVGRVCAAKVPSPAPATLKVTMTDGNAPYVANIYSDP